MVGCNCTDSESGIAVSPTKYELQRNAACSAVEGCSSEFMAAVRVYEVGSTQEVREVCEDGNAYACYCPGVGCHTIILLPNDKGNAVHEYVHAALDSAGIKLDHGPTFEATLEKARELLRSKYSSP